MGAAPKLTGSFATSNPSVGGRRGLPNFMKYLGIIVKESLTDIEVLKGFEILSAKTVGSENDPWNIVKVIGTKKQITLLKNYIKNAWYAHFWNNKEMIVVYKDKIILDNDEAIKYGLSVGIPKEQLDFPKD